MPLYDFENKETKEKSKEWLSINEIENFLKDNPNLRQILSGFSILDPIRLNPSKHLPSDAKERFNQIRKMNPRNTMG